MSDDYLWDKTGEPEPEIARLEELLGDLRHEGEWESGRDVAHAEDASFAEASAPMSDPIEQERVAPIRAWVAGGVLAMAAATALYFGMAKPETETVVGTPAASASTAPVAAVSPCGPSADGLPFAVRGDVICGGVPTSAGRLPVDTWLEPKDAGEATVELVAQAVNSNVWDAGPSGQVQVQAGARLRIVTMGARERRLELTRGSLHAKVIAPPGWFVVETPAATAVDLGCEYDIRVDEQGTTHLTVTAGAVSLEGKGRKAHVPAGNTVIARQGLGPGTVLSLTASASLKSAVERHDRGDARAFSDVLAHARATDAMTLWNLLGSVSAEMREEVVARMSSLALLPADADFAALEVGDADAIDALRSEMAETWLSPSETGPSAPAPDETAPVWQ